MKKRVINIGLIGLGRIGRMHAENIYKSLPMLNLKCIADPAPDMNFIKSIGEVDSFKNANNLISDKSIDAIIISSPTPTHVELIKQCAHNKKHVFCEKPISFSEKEIEEIIKIINNEKIHVQVGLNRRFDDNFLLAKEKVDAAMIGDIQTIQITNHDSSMPKLKFLKSSGGMLFDLCIHDFDMLHFLTGQRIKEIYVNGAVFIEPQLRQIDDIDNAIITLELESGVLCLIDSSRQTHYGYDQRIELFGSEGIILVENETESLYCLKNQKNTQRSKIKDSFIERYKKSYVTELEYFYNCVSSNKKPEVGPENILSAIRVADAGKKSLMTNSPQMVKNE